MGRSFTDSNLPAPISFTGGLPIAADFIQELYVHLGFHPAWKFREVHGIILDPVEKYRFRGICFILSVQ